MAQINQLNNQNKGKNNLKLNKKLKLKNLRNLNSFISKCKNYIKTT